MTKKINPELVVTGIQAGAALAERIITAIMDGDNATWQNIATILPDPLRTRLMLHASKQQLENDLAERRGG